MAKATRTYKIILHVSKLSLSKKHVFDMTSLKLGSPQL